MRLSTKGRYAVMALVDLAGHSNGRPVALADISGRQEISLSYLEQLFAKLLGPKGSLEAAPAPGAQPASVHTAFPEWLVVLALLAAGLLAASELLAPALRIGQARPARAEARSDSSERAAAERVAA